MRLYLKDENSRPPKVRGEGWYLRKLRNGVYVGSCRDEGYQTIPTEARVAAQKSFSNASKAVKKWLLTPGIQHTRDYKRAQKDFREKGRFYYKRFDNFLRSHTTLYGIQRA